MPKQELQNLQGLITQSCVEQPVETKLQICKPESRPVEARETSDPQVLDNFLHVLQGIDTSKIIQADNIKKMNLFSVQAAH